MNTLQKRSWYNLCVAAATLLVSGIVFSLHGFVPALAAGCISFLFLPVPWLFRAKQGEVEYDERVQMIRTNAFYAGAMVAFLTVILIALGICFSKWNKGQDSIDVMVLPLLVVIMSLVFTAGYSIGILTQHRTGGR